MALGAMSCAVVGAFGGEIDCASRVPAAVEGSGALWPAESIAAWAVAFAALIALVGRFATSRPVLVLANLLSVVTSAVLLRPAL